MKTIAKIIYSILGFIILFPSCDREDPASRNTVEDDPEILFFTSSLPGVETRAGDNIDLNRIKENGFEVAGSCMDGVKPVLQFEASLVEQTKGRDEAYRSDKCRWPSNKGDKAGKLRFSAFFPSRAYLREAAGVAADNTDNFKLEYSEDGTEYWMKKFRVNKDISKHSDFVTATAEGNKTDNLYSGVNLNFQHQLSGLNLAAFGNPKGFEIEIAGARIGGIALESDFSFQGKPPRTQYNTKIGRWIDINQTKGSVEYIFQPGDKVVEIGKGDHTSFDDPISIMGTSEYALVIPMDYFVWKDYKNKKNTNQEYLYFSVLLRVKDNLTPGKPLLYPYVEGSELSGSVTTNDKKNIVYLAVESKTGIVRQQVYRKNKNDDPDDTTFYTDPECTEGNEYSPIEGCYIRNYGWASCIPDTGKDPQIRWNAGFKYFYRLNFSEGVGVEDPADAFPGKPIIGPVVVSEAGHEVSDFEKRELQLEVQ